MQRSDSSVPNEHTADKPRLHVALFHPYSAFLDGGNSGGGTYEKAALDLLRSLKPLIDITHFVPHASRKEKVAESTSEGELVITYRPTVFERWLSEHPSDISSLAIRKLGLLRTRQTLRKLGIDLAYFSSPSHMALRLDDFPYIFTVWDTGHRDLPEFEEMASPREYSTREKLFKNAIPKAFHVMVESDVTGMKLEQFYSLESQNWSAVGLLPRVDDVPLVEPSITGEYIIYPAARWPHKNHITLFRAMQTIKKTHPLLRLVLTGYDMGYGATLSREAASLELEDEVLDLGGVTRGELLGLIKGARALVMPSLLGPTNIPPLEALGLGTHAIVSDVHRYGTAVDDMIVKVPAMDAEAWARAIVECLEKENPTPVNFSSDGAIEAHVDVFKRFISSTRT